MPVLLLTPSHADLEIEHFLHDLELLAALRALPEVVGEAFAEDGVVDALVEKRR